MSVVEVVYAAFLASTVVAAGLARPFRRLATQITACWYIGALLFLPAVAYSGVQPQDIVPHRFIGVLVPTPHEHLNKGWIAPVSALIIGACIYPAQIKAFRLALVDVPIVGFCFWPVLQRLWLVAPSSPSSLETSILLLSTWGSPWFLGRIFFSSVEHRSHLVRAIVVVSLIALPLCLFEQVSPMRLSEVLYGPHPFGRDGVERYLGYRPLLFFEHGNQYGIWIACAALCAIWRWRLPSKWSVLWRRATAAAMLVLAALASQSVGAILLLLIGAAGIWAAPLLSKHRGIIACILGVMLVLSLTLVAAAQHPTVRGATFQVAQVVKQDLQRVGRGSLAWRIGRARDALPILSEHVIVGTGRWDWYKRAGFRPWDLPLMLLGQFGLAGLGFVAVAFIAALLRPHHHGRPMPASDRYLVLSLSGMAFADALLNSFAFYPILVLLGSVASRSNMVRPRADGRIETSTAERSVNVSKDNTWMQPNLSG